MFFNDTNDTIAAISTPIGEGGIGIIRISGTKAKEIGFSILKTVGEKLFTDFKDRYLYYGKVVDPRNNQFIDEVLFFYAKKPHSFTAEDILEIQAHGGMIGIKKILEVVLKNGARLAEPGEFTKRAYINGRIDLVQAESIIDLIRAKTEKAHQIALSQLSGRTAKELYELEQQLYQILIAMEALLDFPEEGLPELQKEQIRKKIGLIELKLNHLVATIDEGRKIREGILIVIIGKPNVGKSSLLNSFLQEERAIVTDIPGTTRDVIEAQIQLQGVLVRLIDTAGIRQTDNPIEQIGIEKAENYINEADLILFILDGSQELSTEDRAIAEKVQDKQVLVVINKTDLPQQLNVEELNKFDRFQTIEVSLLTKEGFVQLEKAIIDLAGIGKIKADDRPLLSRIRHKQALKRSIEHLQSFRQGLLSGISEDLLAVDLRSCLEALGEITGKNVSEEVLHGIFAQFCIGK